MGKVAELMKAINEEMKDSISIPQQTIWEAIGELKAKSERLDKDDHAINDLALANSVKISKLEVLCEAQASLLRQVVECIGKKDVPS